MSLENGEKPKKLESPHLRIVHPIGPKQIYINSILETLTESDIIDEKVTFNLEDSKLILNELFRRSRDENISNEEREKWMSLYRAMATS